MSALENIFVSPWNTHIEQFSHIAHTVSSGDRAKNNTQKIQIQHSVRICNEGTLGAFSLSLCKGRQTLHTNTHEQPPQPRLRYIYKTKYTTTQYNVSPCAHPRVCVVCLSMSRLKIAIRTHAHTFTHHTHTRTHAHMSALCTITSGSHKKKNPSTLESCVAASNRDDGGLNARDAAVW